MSQNQMTQLSPELLSATERLAAALRQAQPIAAYHQAENRLTADSQANNLLQQLIVAQNDFRRQQMTGQITSDGMNQIRNLQTQAQNNDLIMAYIEAQQTALAFLPDVNMEISQGIGFDFAALTGAGGC